MRFHNSLTRAKEDFAPIDPAHVRMYVCGPTVYDLAHLGNARPAIVFDVLFRLLRRHFPRVTYVRNITDVDDKINARARESGEPIEAITARTTADYHRDMAALGCLPPTHGAARHGVHRAHDRADRAPGRARPRLRRRRPRAVLRAVLPGLRRVLRPRPGGAARRRAGGRGAVQARPRRLRALEALAARRARPGTARGAPAARAGTSSAPPWRGRRWARCSTSTAAATTWSSRTTRTRWRRAAAPSARRAWRMSGCTTACCAWTARRCRSRSATSPPCATSSSSAPGPARRSGCWRCARTTASRWTSPPTRWRRPRRSSTTPTPCWRARRAAAGEREAARAEMVDWAPEPLLDDLNTPLALARLRDLRTLENVASVGGSATAVLRRIGRDWPLAPGLAAAAFREAAELLGLWTSDPGLWLRGDAGADAERIEAAIAARAAARKARDFASRPHPRPARGRGHRAGGRAAGHHLAARMTGRNGGADLAPPPGELPDRRAGPAAARGQHRRRRARHGEWRPVPPPARGAARRLAAGPRLAHRLRRRPHPRSRRRVPRPAGGARRLPPRLRHLPAAAPRRQAAPHRARRRRGPARRQRAGACAPRCCSGRSAPGSTTTTSPAPTRWCATR